MQSGLLVESALEWGRATGFARYERALKDELIAPPDLRHSTFYGIAKAEAGAVTQVARRGALSFALGGAVSAHWLPHDLSSLYGSDLTSYTLFGRLGF